MGLVTEMGYNLFFKVLVISFLFGYDLRKGFIFLHMLMWTGILSELLKSVFGYPRPVDVDSTLRRIKEHTDFVTPFKDSGAKSFFSLLPPEPVEYFRKLPHYSFGIPSGHTSSTTTVWAAISMFSKKLWVYYLSAMMIVLMAVSRMYLGRHFLADVTAGFILGLLVSLFFYFRFVRNADFNQPVKIKPGHGFRISDIVKYAYFFCFPFIFLLIPYAGLEIAGNVIAFNAAYFIISIGGVPQFKGNLSKRLARLILAAGIFGISFFAYDLLFTNLLHLISPFFLFLKSFITVFMMILVSVKLIPILKIDK